MKNIYKQLKALLQLICRFLFFISQLVFYKNRCINDNRRIVATALTIIFLVPHIAFAKTDKPDCLMAFPSGFNLTQKESCDALDAIGLDYEPVSGKLFFHDLHDCGPVHFSAKYVKLSHGSEHYILIITGNSCTSGIAGADFYLLEKKNHRIHKIAEADAVSNVKISQKMKNSHNILFLYGPGFCHASWIWKHGLYQFDKKICE